VITATLAVVPRWSLNRAGLIIEGISPLSARAVVQSNRKDNRILRGLAAFSKMYPRYSLTMPRPILPPRGYPGVPVSFGEHIKKKRMDLGLRQAQLAEWLGVSESTVWNWEHGITPIPEHQARIRQFLDENL
jgi:hypothetical protein